MVKQKPRYFTGEKALTIEEFEKLLSVVDNSEDRIMLLVGASLGIRRYDLSRIIVRNIDFKNHKLTYLEKKKGDQPHTAFMPDRLEQELSIYVKEKKLGLNDKIFSCKDRQLCNRFYALLDKAEISRRGIHSLRGSCVKFCQKSGWNIEETAKHLNDKVTTIQEHYSTPSDSEMLLAVKKKGVI